jgi:hypothetical protein
MKQWKRMSRLLFAGVGITLACNATGTPVFEQDADPQQLQSPFEQTAQPPSAPPPPGPFRAPLPGTPQGTDEMSTRIHREPPPHARRSRPEFHRGPLFGREREQPDSPNREQRMSADPEPGMATRGWYQRGPAPAFQRSTPPWAGRGMENLAPTPAPEQPAPVTPPATGETAAAPPQTPTWRGAYPPGYSGPAVRSGPQPPYGWRSRQNPPPGIGQSRSPWAPSPAEGEENQQPPGYPAAAYTPPNFPPPPPPAAQAPYFYSGQGYAVPGGTAPPQPGSVPGYYGVAPWGGSGYGRPYPPPYPYGPGPRNW